MPELCCARRPILNLYVDDSGTRNPNHPSARPAHGHDWFGLGGVLIADNDEACIREAHAAFCADWNITYPLHSSEIRGRTGNFSWLAGLPQQDVQRFLNELYALVARTELVGVASVVDRPGYDARYLITYGRDRWSLCRTAFPILLERSVKFAISRDMRLQVFVERSDRLSERALKGYYEALRSQGMPFVGANMQAYSPVGETEFRFRLLDFKVKAKSSPIMQLADLYLWPICIGGYEPEQRTYARLKADGRLLDAHVTAEAIGQLGVKYSCFDFARTTKNPA